MNRLTQAQVSSHTPQGAQGNGDPYAQIDKTAQIEPGPDTYCSDGY